MIEITSEIISGFISKVVNDFVDNRKDANNNNKLDGQGLETRIYQATIAALNEFTKRKYEKQDIVCDVAESILKGLKNSGSNYPEAVRKGLKMLMPQVTSEICEDFLRTLCDEICKEENNVLYKEIVMDLQKQIDGNIQEGFKENIQRHEETNKKLDYVIEKIDRKGDSDEEKHSNSYIENRVEEYAKKWEDNVFLNNYNEEDENFGVNIKLKDIYLEEYMPHYIWKTNTKPSDKLRRLLKKYIVDNNDKKMLLILGQPGIGKSTLITWIMANLIEKKDDIYVYQFASDLKDIDWQGDDILNNIFKTLNLNNKQENKVLILDGFDEIHANSDRERILNQIYHNLKGMNYLNNFSLIISCRKNYIYELHMLRCDYITLQEWDEKQISSFCETYGNVSKKVISQNRINKIISNKEILGIPLILYMVLALDISIGENNSLGDIYDKIFSLDGGIYDRCINNISYGHEHWINRIKEQIHQISQRIAFWIFENNSEKAFITKDKYEWICDNVTNDKTEESEGIKRDFFIGSYFEPIKHCEGIGTDELQFVHRSIYEYFVAVFFFQSIYKIDSKEEMAKKMGILLKNGYLSEQILEFIKYKFDDMQENSMFGIVKGAFQIMLRDGMAYHVGIPLLNIINREMNIFSNMLKIVLLWNSFLGELDEKIVCYLRYNRQSKLDLRGIRLKGSINLPYVYLKEANLEQAYFGRKIYEIENGKRAEIIYLKGANLKGANLKKARLLWVDLEEANLEEANLEEANLLGSNLKGANLKKANLNNTIFDEKQIIWLHRKCNLINSRVYISKTKEIISYKKYFVKKLKK